jgi:hypothetical protein
VDALPVDSPLRQGAKTIESIRPTNPG